MKRFLEFNMSTMKLANKSKSNHEPVGNQEKNLHYSSSATETQSKSEMQPKEVKRKKRRVASRNSEKREYDLRTTEEGGLSRNGPSDEIEISKTD